MAVLHRGACAPNVGGSCVGGRRWGNPAAKPSRDVVLDEILMKGGYVMENITLQDFIGLMLMLIAFATLVLKLFDSKKH